MFYKGGRARICVRLEKYGRARHCLVFKKYGRALRQRGFSLKVIAHGWVPVRMYERVHTQNKPTCALSSMVSTKVINRALNGKKFVRIGPVQGSLDRAPITKAIKLVCPVDCDRAAARGYFDREKRRARPSPTDHPVAGCVDSESINLSAKNLY